MRVDKLPSKPQPLLLLPSRHPTHWTNHGEDSCYSEFAAPKSNISSNDRELLATKNKSLEYNTYSSPLSCSAWLRY